MLKINGYFRSSIVYTLLFAMLSMLAACNSFEENSYKTLKSMAVAYSAVMDAAYEHYQSMDDAEEQDAFWATVKKYSDPIRSSIAAAKGAVMAYTKAAAAYDAALAASDAENRTEEEQTDLDQLLEKVNAAKAAASAALQAVDVDAFKETVQTIIALFND